MGRSDVIAALRREAGLVGCDAIVITGGIEETEIRGFGSAGFGYRATCIVYDRSIAPTTTLPAPTSAPAAQAPTVVPASAARSPAASAGAPSATTTATVSFPPTQ
jgi:hypothetical protein